MVNHIVLVSALALVCFLYATNLFLRGQWKQKVEAVLGLLVFALVILAFVFLGWRWGIGFIFLSLLFVGISRPFAQGAAYRMLGYRTGIDDDPGVDVMGLMSNGKVSFEEAMARVRQQGEVEKQRLQKIAGSPSINYVLAQHTIDLEGYHAILRGLRASALHDLAWEIVSSPTDLASYIDMKTAGRSDQEIWSHFRNFGQEGE